LSRLWRGVVSARGLGLGLALAAAVLVAAPLQADTVHLVGGDRITGKVTASGKKAKRVTTAYGRLLIPTDKIDKVVYDDGREESFLPPPAPLLVPEHLRVQFAMTGDSFWQAWEPKSAPADPTLRLLILLDGEPVAAYVDAQLDSDIAKAVVNTFAFDPGQTVRTTWAEARALPPEAKPGLVRFDLELPLRHAGTHRIGLVYQSNAGNKERPDWRDLMKSELEAVELAQGVPAAVRIEQSRGEMSFSGMLKKQMKKMETFRVQMLPDHEATAAAPPAAVTR
jgi:hypothetical protein